MRLHLKRPILERGGLHQGVLGVDDHLCIRPEHAASERQLGRDVPASARLVELLSEGFRLSQACDAALMSAERARAFSPAWRP